MAGLGLNFILGNPRSGTSLLRLMLNAHPDISAPPECGFVMWLRDRYIDLDLGDASIVARFASDVSASRKFETWGLPRERLGRELAKRQYDNYPQMAAAVHLAYGTFRGKTPKVLLDKNNYYISDAQNVAAAFPDGRFVHLVRDGRDVACSYLELAKRSINSEYRPRLPVDIGAVAREWRNNCMAADQLSPDRAMRVRYEDLTSEPVAELSRICEYLGVPFNASMVEFYRWNDEPEEFIQWKEKTIKPLDRTSVGRYAKYLCKHDIIKFERIAGDALRHFGYRCESAGI